MHVRDPACNTSKCRRLTRSRSQIGWGVVKLEAGETRSGESKEIEVSGTQSADGFTVNGAGSPLVDAAHRQYNRTHSYRGERCGPDPVAGGEPAPMTGNRLRWMGSRTMQKGSDGV